MKEKKNMIYGVIFFFLIIIAIEIGSQYVMGNLYECESRLPASGIYENKTDEELIKLCDDYRQIKVINVEKNLSSEIQEQIDIKKIKEIIDLQNYPIIKNQEFSKMDLEPNQHLDTINVNNYGFRGKDISLEKESKTYRIFVLGGSTVFGGYSSSDSTTIPGYLEEKLNSIEMDFKIDVINAGEQGAASCRDIEKIKTKIINFNPDLIIVLNGWNDLDRPCKETISEMPQRVVIISEIMQPIRDICSDCQSPRLVILSYSWIQTQIQEVFENKQNGKNFKVIVNDWKSRWVETCEYSKEMNFDLIITLEPLIGTGEKTITDWEKNTLSNYSSDAITSYDLMRSAIKDLDSKCTSTHDISNVFDSEEETIFYDLGHFGDKGSELVAEELFNILKPIIINKIIKT